MDEAEVSGFNHMLMVICIFFALWYQSLGNNLVRVLNSAEEML